MMINIVHSLDDSSSHRQNIKTLVQEIYKRDPGTGVFL